MASHPPGIAAIRQFFARAGFMGFVAAFVLPLALSVLVPVHDASAQTSVRRSSAHRFESNIKKRSPVSTKSYHDRKKSAYDLSQDRKRSRRADREHNGEHQLGGYCMYGLNGELLHRPPARSCSGPPAGYAAPGSADQDGFSVEMPIRNALGQSLGRCIQGRCESGYGVYAWPDGSRYIGSFQNGKQHGEGTLVLFTGDSYVGQWMSGMRWGQGKAIYSSGDAVAGAWVRNDYVGDVARRSDSPQDAYQQRRASTIREKVVRAKTKRVKRVAKLRKIRWPDLRRAAKATGGGSKDAAVVIGLEHYAHVSPIDNASDNARDWYRYLVKTRGVPVERVTLLVDEDATVEEMRFATMDAAKQVKKGGTLWFVFVGHGAPSKSGDDGLLVGFDVQQKARSLQSRSLPRGEVLALLQQSRAKQVNVFLDACFSGKDDAGAELVAGLQPLIVTSEQATSDARTMLMTAARSNEFAGPLPGARRPAFSYLALGGLRGWADENRNGKVTAAELHEYVTGAMRVLVRDRTQRPSLVGDGSVNLVKSAREQGPDLSDLVVRTSASRPASVR